jgi:hypothetical protein
MPRVLVSGLIIAAGLLVSACGSTASGTASDPASVGQAVTIDTHGVDVTVTLEKEVDPAPVYCNNQNGICLNPLSGSRYIAVDLTVTNLAPTTFCFSPDPDITGRDAVGNSYQASPGIETPSNQWSGTGNDNCGPNTSLAAGKTSSGWAGFDVPTGISLKGAVFTVNRLNQNGTSFITVDGASAHWKV